MSKQKGLTGDQATCLAFLEERGHTPFAKGTKSRQLCGQLMRRGYVEWLEAAGIRLYSITPAGIDALNAYCDEMKEAEAKQ